MPLEPTAQKSDSILRLGVFGGWLLFTLMVIAISWTGAVLRGRPPALGGLLVWNLGWLLWAGGTFLVVHLARRFPLERHQLFRGISFHALLGIAVGISLLALEFVLNQAIERIWPGGPRGNAFLGFIVYKFHVYFLIYWMILGATRAYDFHRKYRETELRASQLDARLAQAQLHVLKTQLHPHFLFNTHHAIISLMLKQDTTGAIKMLTRLSDLLRITLQKTDQQLSSVRDELDAVELYLGIQRERYGKRLDVHLDVGAETLSAEIPSLLLQPLVENAFKHGIDGLASDGVLHIRVWADPVPPVTLSDAVSRCLHATVTDNGAGFRAGFRLENCEGIGLRNTRARLARLYPNTHSLAWRNLTPSGAEVSVTLPFRAFEPVTERTTAAIAHE
jgi:two-component system, LytTR family, sensor kinase